VRKNIGVSDVEGEFVGLVDADGFDLRFDGDAVALICDPLLLLLTHRDIV
jgi:hypothetical protein